MNKEKIIEAEHHSALAFSYIHRRIVYSMSLQLRACYDIEYATISFNTDDKKLNTLSDKELKKMINSLKAPKWNAKYEYIKERNKHLLIPLCYIPSQILLNILYRILKIKNK